MGKSRLRVLLWVLILPVLFAVGGLAAFGQQPSAASQEVSEVDGQPVLIKHLPDYERVQSSAAFGTDKSTLVNIASHAVIKDLEFPTGTEYVSAPYPEGRLLIIEYTNPQSSAEADATVQRYVAGHPEPGFAYRRIGNYNSFVFDTTDVAGANTLLDQVKYEKTIQWLGEDPFLLKKVERYLVLTSRDIMISTVLVILIGLASSVVAGIVAGFIFFRFRDRRRAGRTAFSDGGGLTRINLDGFSE